MSTVIATINSESDQGERITQAFQDWRSRRAYVDNSGNYRVKSEGRSSGPVAPWNKEVKAKFGSVKEFHDVAQQSPLG